MSQIGSLIYGNSHLHSNDQNVRVAQATCEILLGGNVPTPRGNVW